MCKQERTIERERKGKKERMSEEREREKKRTRLLCKIFKKNYQKKKLKINYD